jgi:hypothetical protein
MQGRDGSQDADDEQDMRKGDDGVPERSKEDAIYALHVLASMMPCSIVAAYDCILIQ